VLTFEGEEDKGTKAGASSLRDSGRLVGGVCENKNIIK
jgi:hypothetical protein